MKFSIENILSIAPSKIYQRGLDYYRSNKIVRIERKNNDISAEVEGSNGEIYVVSIDFDKNGNVKYYDCDCPYDGGPICKHIVAVLLKLSEDDVQYNLPLEEMLESLTKEKLIKIIVDLANKDSKIKDKLYNKFASSLDINTNIESEIDDIIYAYSDRDGFVNYDVCYDMCMEIDAVVNDEFDLYKTDNSLEHIKNLLIVNHKTISLMDKCDDSDGGIITILYDIKESLFTACEDILNSNDEEKCIEFLSVIFNEVKNKNYDYWLESKCDLLNIAVQFSKYNKSKVFEILDDFINQCEKEQKYYLSNAVLLKFKFLEMNENEKSAEEFLYRYSYVDDICEHFVKKYVDEKKYDLAEKLCIDKIKNTDYPIRWESLLSSVYEESKQFDKQLKIELDSLINGNANSYTTVKNLMKKFDLWNKNRDALLKKLSQKLSVYDYADILRDEKEYDKLLCLVKEHRLLIKSYFPFIATEYPEDAYKLYSDYIIYLAQRSSSRKEYQSCCKEIKSLYDAGGSAEAKRLVMFLKNKYRRKPAFLDELNKLSN